MDLHWKHIVAALVQRLDELNIACSRRFVTADALPITIGILLRFALPKSNRTLTASL
jgi:hypothetical protein